jgi:hypothetical protein
MNSLIGKKIFVFGLMLEIAVVFFSYHPSLENLFVWDDESYIYYLPFVRESTFWLKALTEPFFISTNYYRPLPLLTFMLDYRLGGGQPWLFHLTNLLFHIVNTVLVVFLTATGSGPLQRPTVPLKIWRCWPDYSTGCIRYLVEPVAWISGRFDLMVTFFLLLALLLDGLPSLWKRSIGIGLCFFLAALCKEMAVAFPLVLVFWHLALADRPAQGLGSLHGLLALLLPEVRPSLGLSHPLDRGPGLFGITLYGPGVSASTHLQKWISLGSHCNIFC